MFLDRKLDYYAQCREVKSPIKGLVTCTRIHTGLTLAVNADGICNCRTQVSFDETKEQLLHDFLHRSLHFSEHVCIAVQQCHCYDTPQPYEHTLLYKVQQSVQKFFQLHSHRPLSSCTVLPVANWGQFIPALNMLVNFAVEHHYDRILFQSLEVCVHDWKHVIPTLYREMLQDDTLVAGVALEGHSFMGSSVHLVPDDSFGNKEGVDSSSSDEEDEVIVDDGKEEQVSTPVVVKLDGLTCPWNTLAMWNTNLLSPSGFLPVAEGLIKGVPAGVEEVTAILQLQTLHTPDKCKAKLLSFVYDMNSLPEHLRGYVSLQQQQEQQTHIHKVLSPVSWYTASFQGDPAREAWHKEKMKSKLERSLKQMGALNLPPGEVLQKEVRLPVPPTGDKLHLLLISLFM